MGETLRKSMREIEPRNSIYEVVPLKARIRDAFAANRLRTILLASFAITAVLLACVGLYGTLSYIVNVRRREIGLRLALGALREQIAGEFVRQGVGASALGCLAGLALAAAFSRLLAGMLYGVSPSDAITFTGVVVIVRLDPMQVLREE